MDDDERKKLARLCRGQATLASTLEVRSVLIGLAERYDVGTAGKPEPSLSDPGEGTGKDLK